MNVSHLAKWPRHYAAEIILLKTAQQRREALSSVPSDFQDWVAFYVRDYFTKRRFKRRTYA